jgi:hypothetical protein
MCRPAYRTFRKSVTIQHSDDECNMSISLILCLSCPSPEINLVCVCYPWLFVSWLYPPSLDNMKSYWQTFINNHRTTRRLTYQVSVQVIPSSIRIGATNLKIHIKYKIIINISGCWDSVVGITTGYGLDDRGVGVRVPVGSRLFCSPLRPDRLWGPPSLLSNGYIPRG